MAWRIAHWVVDQEVFVEKNKKNTLCYTKRDKEIADQLDIKISNGSTTQFFFCIFVPSPYALASE